MGVIKTMDLFALTVETSLLILMISVINILLRKRLDPNIRYLLWIFVAIRLLMPVRVILPLEVPWQWDMAATSVQAPQMQGAADGQATEPPSVEGLSQYTETIASPSLPAPPVALDTETAAPTPTAVSPSLSPGKAIRLVWVLGMAVMTGYIMLGNRKVFMELRANRQELDILEGGIPLYAMPGYNCLAGVVSPAVYIDADALKSPDVIQNVIAHELQHYRVRDNYWQFLRVICLILQWHNPLMWWAYYASKRDCEAACDARVIREMSAEERYGYGNSLLAAAEGLRRKKTQAVLCSTPMGGSKAFMRQRICDIMQYRRRYAVGLLAVIVCVLALGCFVSLHLYAGEEKNPAVAAKGDPAVGSVPEDQPNELLPEEMKEAVPVSVNVADYYITSTGNPDNLYYIDENNVLWGCGRNNCGQLGQGTQDYEFYEDMVKIAEHVIHVDYSDVDLFTIYLTEDHKLYGMGNAGCGALQQYEEFDRMQYANGEHYTVNSPVLLMENVAYARCGRSDVVCLTEDNEVWIFGTVGFDWTQTCFYAYPTKVLEDAVFVTGGSYNHAALLRDGSVWTWGYNYAGSCGVPGGGIVPEPTKVAEDVRMVWTGSTKYNVNVKDIADFEGTYERGMENTLIQTADGEYLICGVCVGTEKNILPIYYETTHYALVCTHEFRPLEEYRPYERRPLIELGDETLNPSDGSVPESETDMPEPKDPADIQVFTIENVAVAPQITEYDYESACEAGEVRELRGILPGLGEGTWYTVSVDGVEYYYGKYDAFPDRTELFEYAIVSDIYSLANGISVGMTKDEVLKRYPNMVITDTAGNILNGMTHMGWNHTAYPRSPLGMDEELDYEGKEYYYWDSQFDYIMIADIIQEPDTLPLAVALMMKDDAVAAITFYYPTAN